MIAAEAQHHPGRTPAAAFQAAARALIVRTLLLEEAARQEVNPAPAWVGKGKREMAEESQIRQLLESRVPVPEVEEQACLAYYEERSEHLRSPELFEASHILFAAPPGDAEGEAKAKAASLSALEELSRQPGRFEAMAQEFSDCPSKSGGGRLGQLGPGQIAPELEAVLARLEPGETAREPVKSRWGFHILRLDARKNGERLPFGYVRDKIAAHLGERQWRRDVAAFIETLVARAQIEGLDMARTEAAKA
jgi:peptidyl-prolyl cis-trans isomerase C